MDLRAGIGVAGRERGGGSCPGAGIGGQPRPGAVDGLHRSAGGRSEDTRKDRTYRREIEPDLRSAAKFQPCTSSKARKRVRLAVLSGRFDAGSLVILPITRRLFTEDQTPCQRQLHIIPLPTGVATHGYLQGEQPWKIEQTKVGKPHITGTAKEAFHSEFLHPKAGESAQTNAGFLKCDPAAMVAVARWKKLVKTEQLYRSPVSAGPGFLFRLRTAVNGCLNPAKLRDFPGVPREHIFGSWKKRRR